MTVGLAEIVFLLLKLTGAVSWQWLWVVSPLWIACGVGETLFFTGSLITGIAHGNDR